MNLSANKIIGLRTLTRSGDYLGRVVSFELDTSSQTVKRYYVKKKSFGRWFLNQRILLKNSLIISARQVVSIDKDKLVVEDAVLKEGAEEKKEGLVRANVS